MRIHASSSSSLRCRCPSAEMSAGMRARQSTLPPLMPSDDSHSRTPFPSCMHRSAYRLGVDPTGRRDRSHQDPLSPEACGSVRQLGTQVSSGSGIPPDAPSLPPHPVLVPQDQGGRPAGTRDQEGEGDLQSVPCSDQEPMSPLARTHTHTIADSPATILISVELLASSREGN